MQSIQNESTEGMESDLLEKIWASNTTISTRITTIRLKKVGAATIEIRPRDVGKDSQGWSVGEAQIPIKTLEDAIIIGMEIQARQ